MDGRDTIPLNGLPLCGSQALRGEPCSWSENAVISNSKVYIGQPDNNRVIVFHSQQLNVVHVIGTDPRPSYLWLVRSEVEDSIWLLNSGKHMITLIDSLYRQISIYRKGLINLFTFDQVNQWK